MKKFILNTKYVSGLTSLTLMATLAVGCTYKSTPKNENEAAVETKIKDQPTYQLDNLDNIDLLTAYEDLKQIEKATAADKDSRSQKVVDTLKPYVLNKKIVENPQYALNDKMRSALSIFNYALMKLIDSGKASQDTIVEFANMVQRGCDANLANCYNLAFYKTDWRSSEILVAYAEKLDAAMDAATDKGQALKDYYRILKLALDLKNGTKNDKLNLLFIKRTQEYAQYLNTQTDVRSNVILDQAGKVFELMVSDIETKKNDPKMIEFIKAFKPWAYSRLQTDLFQYGTKKIFTAAAQTQLYGQNGKLNEDFLQALKKTKTENDKLGKSFYQSIQDLKKDNPEVAKQLPIEDIDFESEYFFIVDRLYRGHLAVDEVAEIWQAVAAKNGIEATKKLDQTISNYLRWEFLKLVISTNEYVRAYYQKGDFDPKELIKSVVQNSRDKDDEWASLNRRADDLKNLLLRYLNNSDSSDYKAKSINLIASIPRNTKYLASYPNMMLLAYMLQKTDSSLTIETWFGPIAIPAGVVINAFLNGFIAPWFNFSKDFNPLNQVEILIAYDYALKTEVFKSLQILDGQFRISQLDFLKAMVKSYFSEEVKRLEIAQSFLVDAQSNSDYATFLSICRGTPAVDIKFDDVTSILLVGNGYTSKGLTYSSLPIYFSTGNTNPKELLAELNASFQQKRVVVDILGKILTKYYSRDGAQSAEVVNTLKNINTEVQFVKEKLSAYHKVLFNLKDTADKCLDHLRPIEKSLVYEMLKQEKAYLAQVYNSLKALKTKNATEKDAAIKALIEQSQSRGKDSIEDASAYRYSRLGFIYRTLSRLENTTYKISVKSFPADSDLKKFDVGSLRLDLIEEGRELSQEEFVRKAMQRLNGQSGAFINWLEHLNDNELLEKRIQLSVEMYQTGIMLSLPDAERVTAKDLVSNSMALMNSFHLNDQEAALLKDMGLDYRINPARFDAYFKRGTDYQAPMDYTFGLIKAKDDADKGLLLAAESFYQTWSGVKEEGYFIFPPDKDLFEQLKLSYTPLVKNYERVFNDISSAISACKVCSERPLIRFDLRPDKAPYQGILESREMRMLNENNSWFFNSRMRQFHERTKNSFAK